MKYLALGLCLVAGFFISILVLHHLPHAKAETKPAAAPAAPPLVASPTPPPRSSSGSEMALSPGTVVSVSLADPIDSQHDTFGRQYVASVDTIDGQAIPPNTQATVVVLNTNTGFHTQLTGLTVKGHKFQVHSGAGSVIGAEQRKDPGSSGLALLRIGQAPASDGLNDPIRMAPETQLRFTLIAGTPGSLVAGTSRSREFTSRPSRNTTDRMLPAEIQWPDQPEISYLCGAIEPVDQVLPVYYIADTFKASSAQVLVENRWHTFLATTYPYRFANNQRATTRCNRLSDTAGELDARQGLTGGLNTQSTAAPQPRWHYTLGPIPSPVQ